MTELHLNGIPDPESMYVRMTNERDWQLTGVVASERDLDEFCTNATIAYHRHLSETIESLSQQIQATEQRHDRTLRNRWWLIRLELQQPTRLALHVCGGRNYWLSTRATEQVELRSIPTPYGRCVRQWKMAQAIDRFCGAMVDQVGCMDTLDEARRFLEGQ